MSTDKKIVVVKFYDSKRDCRSNVELYVPKYFVEGQILYAFKQKIGWGYATFARDIQITERRV